MKITRRNYLSRTAAGAGAALLARVGSMFASGRGEASADKANSPPHNPVMTPNGSSLPWKLKDGVKEFHLVAEPVRRDFAPGMQVNCWGYNGSTPGPTIEAIEGDRVRLLVTNRLPEHTTIHWHGIFLPNGMDGVGGLTQPQIQPGETYAYEFTLRQHGTFMYHPHADEMTQMAMGLMGFFVVHPKEPRPKRIDRDFAIFLAEWHVEPGTSTPNPNIMTDFNLFTFNGRAYPGTDPLLIQQGDLVRLRFGNVSMDSHPIHIHGHRFLVVETDGGPIPESAQWPETTINVPPGTTRVVEFVADAPGDWPLHCHKSHHAMNQMDHDIPNVIGVDQSGVEERIGALVPGYMAMGGTGMAEHSKHAHHLEGVENTLPMMTGDGPFGPIEMGGMFTVLKIRERLEPGRDPGWHRHPPGTVASRWEAE